MDFYLKKPYKMRCSSCICLFLSPHHVSGVLVSPQFASLNNLIKKTKKVSRLTTTRQKTLQHEQNKRTYMLLLTRRKTRCSSHVCRFSPPSSSHRITYLPHRTILENRLKECLKNRQRNYKTRCNSCVCQFLSPHQVNGVLVSHRFASSNNNNKAFN